MMAEAAVRTIHYTASICSVYCDWTLSRSQIEISDDTMTTMRQLIDNCIRVECNSDLGICRTWGLGLVMSTALLSYEIVACSGSPR